MSKKKAVSGSTMSLKDFHGGSIPSDLPLPSAPGLVVRSGSDRNMSTNRGNNLMRPDPRPKSSGAARIFDEKASFLSQPAPIGRNFDEDERKPLDGISAPRRTISDDNVRTLPPIRQDLRPDYVSSLRVCDRPASSPVSQSSSLGSGSFPLRTGGGNSFGVNSQTPIGNHGPVVNNLQASSGNNSQPPIGNNGEGVSNPPNAWGVRRDVAVVNKTGSGSVLSGSNAVSKVVQASAVEKVSLGMWQSKSPGQLLPHLLYSRNNNVPDGVKERSEYDDSQGSQAESGWIAEDGTQGGVRELLSYETERPQMCAKEFRTSANNGGSILPPATPPDISERPKLNLLPRSKPLETSENGYRQGYQQPADSGKVEFVSESNEYANPPKPEPVVAEGGSQPAERRVERPRLNLKPRSQPLEQSDGSLESERKKLFGGARPREMVLKQRGVDEIEINNVDLSHSANRVNSPKNEATSEHLVPTARHSHRTDNLSLDKRTGKNLERKEQRMDHEKADNQRRNRRTENWRGSRDAEKQQQDRRPEPDTWRKPIDEPTPASPDHHGKLVSAVDLAQAFSKSVSVLKTPDRYSAQSGLPACSNQMPFSRLTDTQEPPSASTSRHRINGY